MFASRFEWLSVLSIGLAIALSTEGCSASGGTGLEADGTSADGQPAELDTTGSGGDNPGSTSGESSGDGSGTEAGGDVPTGGAFRHPGVLLSSGQLNFLKGKIAAHAEPWASALAAAKGSPFGALNYVAHPVSNVVCGPFSKPDVGCTDELNDAIAAYTDALAWALTGDAQYAEKSTQIMNAWSAKIKQHTNSNAPLQAAWVGAIFARAAEIVRYTYPAWGGTNVSRVASMLKNVYLPEVINGSKGTNGNWELAMAEATVSIGVFLDDQATFSKGVKLWRGRVPAYFYLSSDGPLPKAPPGGAPKSLIAYWYNQSKFVNGLSQETCRDLAHVQNGFGAMIHAAETAKIQGVDLYGEESKRITAAMELHATYVLGGSPPSWLCGGRLNLAAPLPTWEVAYNNYANRSAIHLPLSNKVIAKIRPTGNFLHMNWETLTHAETGAAGL